MSSLHFAKQAEKKKLWLTKLAEYAALTNESPVPDQVVVLKFKKKILSKYNPHNNDKWPDVECHLREIAIECFGEHDFPFGYYWSYLYFSEVIEGLTKEFITHNMFEAFKVRYNSIENVKNDKELCSNYDRAKGRGLSLLRFVHFNKEIAYENTLAFTKLEMRAIENDYNRRVELYHENERKRRGWDVDYTASGVVGILLIGCSVFGLYLVLA
ncbi:uncharacterized protein SPAPADRAFT_60510 [Spathaspora passalidarum NRRL Y-27907]|uniref:Uncharacterized protein n=1 Tax=Spathaspora passalidarum (strain NRRL Y-27907 / 11-Y1) TaxID=619300 RepID=G3ALE3_SPAPN|nr:uncharacterized protein SPAPADRAFT_60510 [Spathaspora passalidarum NRRL Y-27907]EGW33185.1 hypothetical protein SPAPADRAFT_60510 [Spathaspora passalidarum NRRL Y-27907]